ncbi:MAG: hypothetical protein IJS58_08055 [Bacilli bacterium]|nr:hypothetical protein [Bacilli bacterium]
MNIVYKNKNIQRICNDYDYTLKHFGKEIATKLFELINYIDEINNLHILTAMPQYRVHLLHHNREYQYSIVISKSSKWRLIIYPLDKDGQVLKKSDNEIEKLVNSVGIMILEVSEHYDK